MGITFGSNDISGTEGHPYANYPSRFKRIFNNFMMSKSEDALTDAMNWSYDLRLYGMHKVFDDAGLQLPSFSMANEVFIKYRLAPE